MTPTDPGERLVAIESTQTAHTELLKEIRDQAKLTNGRVTSIELWKARITGAWVVVSFAGPVITGLIITKL